jgi:hypothetical protein
LELERDICSEKLPAALPQAEWPGNYFKCGHILCRNCLLKHGMQGKIEEQMEVTGIQGRRRKQLLDDFWKGESTVN